MKKTTTKETVTKAIAATGGAVAGAAITRDPVIGAAAGALVAAVGEAAMAEMRRIFESRFERWWRVVTDDPTTPAEVIADRIRDEFSPESAAVVRQSVRTLEDIVDDDVVPPLGVLAHEYLSASRAPDRFFRSMTTMLRQCDKADLAQLREVIAEACIVAETSAAVRINTLASESGEEIISVVQHEPLGPEEVAAAGPGARRSCGGIEAVRIVYLLGSSGVGANHTVWGGNAVVLSAELARRVNRVLRAGATA